MARISEFNSALSGVLKVETLNLPSWGHTSLDQQWRGSRHCKNLHPARKTSPSRRQRAWLWALDHKISIVEQQIVFSAWLRNVLFRQFYLPQHEGPSRGRHGPRDLPEYPGEHCYAVGSWRLASLHYIVVLLVLHWLRREQRTNGKPKHDLARSLNSVLLFN